MKLVLLNCTFILWIVCWGSFGTANDEEHVDSVEHEINARVMANMMMSNQNEDSRIKESLDREEVVEFARAALNKLKEHEEQVSTPEHGDENKENSDTEARKPIEDIDFTAKERVMKAREEQQRLDAEIYLRKGIFELMVDQMKNDLAPFLLLIPPPVKIYVRSVTTKLIDQGKSMLTGALFPMAMSGIKVAKIGVEVVKSLSSVVQTVSEKARNLLDQLEADALQAHEEKQALVSQHGANDNASYLSENYDDITGKQEVYEASAEYQAHINDSDIDEEGYGEEVIEL
eukprot:gene28345-34221_t